MQAQTQTNQRSFWTLKHKEMQKYAIVAEGDYTDNLLHEYMERFTSKKEAMNNKLKGEVPVRIRETTTVTVEEES